MISAVELICGGFAGFSGFDGIDWDIEGVDTATSLDNTFPLLLLKVIGEFLELSVIYT